MCVCVCMCVSAVVVTHVYVSAGSVPVRSGQVRGFVSPYWLCLQYINYLTGAVVSYKLL